MNIVLTGSVAYDFLMTFPGKFKEHILPDQLDRISLSFLADSLIRRRGGVAANIAYTLALLGERPTVMATVGEDFEEYRGWLDRCGVDTSAIKVVPGLFTSSFFVTTDTLNAQIATFYPGAMARASELQFKDLNPQPDLAIISPNDPVAMDDYVHQCRQLGVPFAYDPGQQIVRLDAGTIRDGIEQCQFLFVNDYEAGLIERVTGLGPEDIQAQGKLVVITLGEKGADLYLQGERIRVPAAQPQQIADPTGVGDAFRGGFLKGHMHGLSLQRCGEMGVVAATICLESDGPQSHTFDIQSFTSRYRQFFDDQGELDQIQ